MKYRWREGGDFIMYGVQESRGLLCIIAHCWSQKGIALAWTGFEGTCSHLLYTY